MARCMSIFVVVFVLSGYFSVKGEKRSAYEFKTITWNMQGSADSSGQSKWSTLGNELKNKKYEIVALQECGAPPEKSMRLIKRKVDYKNYDLLPQSKFESDYVPLSGFTEPGDKGPYLTAHQDDPGDLPLPPENRHINRRYENVREFVWSLGGARSGGIVDFYVYHYALSDKNRDKVKTTARTNLAIVSKLRADEVIVFTDGTNANRPVLGIRNDSVYFFSIHAPAFRKNRSPESMKNLVNYLEKHEKDSTWMMMGDFNREDLNDVIKNVEPKQQIINPGRATQDSGGMLDYAFIGPVTYTDPKLMKASLLGSLKSDHTAVSFEPEEKKNQKNDSKQKTRTKQHS